MHVHTDHLTASDMRSTNERLKMEHTVPVYVALTVKVADWHEHPTEAATALVRDALTPHVRPDHDWDGRFAIVAERFNVTATPYSSD